MSSNVQRDLILARKLGIRSIFFSENAIVEDYMFMKDFKPEFHVINHPHFISVLKQIDRDIEYLDKIISVSNFNFDYLDYLHELPSQNLTNVGLVIHSSPNKPRYGIINNGLFTNSENTKYFHICLDVPLEYQGPFNMIIWKLIYFFKNLEDEDSKLKIYNLEKYWEDNDVILINKFEKVKNLLTRSKWNAIANEFLQSEECKAICKKYNRVARTSKMMFIWKENL